MDDLYRLISLVKTTSCAQTLEGLSKTPHMLVRRAVARSKFTSVDTLNKLAFDKVQNVSYMALQNTNCKVTRIFKEDSLSSCVLCNEDELTRDCNSCMKKFK